MSEKTKDDENAAQSLASDAGALPGDEYHSELPPHSFVNLAAALPESLSVPIDAPAPRRAMSGARSAESRQSTGPVSASVAAPVSASAAA